MTDPATPAAIQMEHIMDAIQCVRDIAESVNERRREAEHFERLVQIQKRVGYKRIGTLLRAGRKVVFNGDGLVRSSISKTPRKFKHQEYFLFNDAIMWMSKDVGVPFVSLLSLIQRSFLKQIVFLSQH